MQKASESAGIHWSPGAGAESGADVPAGDDHIRDMNGTRCHLITGQDRDLRRRPDHPSG
jgi:hypothetical protein